MAPVEIGQPVFGVDSPKPTSQSPSLYDHTLITTDFDALKFHAAASLQLQFGHAHETAALQSDLLITSPYNDPKHLLDLKTLDTPNQLLAKALTILRPIRDDYATAPYTESFNWQAVFNFLRDLAQTNGYRWETQHFYVVVFRSRLQADIDKQRLHDLDAYSHQEAVASGGLLKYWFGTKDGERRNLATCLWRSRNDARLGGTGPWHKKARGAARDMYEDITFTTLKLVIEDDVRSWRITDWTEEDE
ncbi:hypothetical protein AFCA_010497 [Aspergillus flavus]|uniref:DNA, SC038 n=4 Tax=Aspergillus subgen. Circumdati TaxID=2720871 RepID=Q2U2L2_ASPOR|nr:unnamed protein product [Aspergillus oryzae RIB40]EIT74630.1 hypothetical protein Ao3042_09255 [Aspergillus oryzae 3.042]OOO09094.1 hypothetical protein OAory_01103900 [Aspergillus oryzae]RAQ55441.1 hypothetical protein AFGD_007588 [Aspergillus flavus]RMZ45201.1 hypothetical protein CA14_006920 [Aspergillus flavus]UDD63225.1 hypothetical protein AFCA_010497 [Aspergillus flavus]|eukprot:EIT74630.1 hypothetical protein Ao3042_09255 [Aspergillus oryzae 3.042]